MRGGAGDGVISAANANPGVRPVRIKGYYRAVKRGEQWAVKIAKALVDRPFQGMLLFTYRNVDFNDLVYHNNPFLALLPPEMPVDIYYVPVKLKK